MQQVDAGELVNAREDVVFFLCVRACVQASVCAL